MTVQKCTTDAQFARSPFQQCAQRARRERPPAEGRRDDVRRLHAVINTAKLDSADRFPRSRAPNGKRKARPCSPFVLEPLNYPEVVRVGLCARLLDSPAEEPCSGCVLGEEAMAPGVCS